MAKKCWIEKWKNPRKFPVQQHNRCSLCGRSRAYLRRFELCRLCFRKFAVRGEIPGVVKATW
ncbi:type Z 30S ribosomal protein S14 [bacterium]|nr:type Z 30S ribosomal protein S14 [bacterium]